MGSLGGAKLLKLEVMSSQEGVEYLKKQLGAKRVEEELEAAKTIVSLCGGLPLALAIAGGVLKEEETLSEIFTVTCFWNGKVSREIREKIAFGSIGLV